MMAFEVRVTGATKVGMLFGDKEIKNYQSCFRSRQLCNLFIL